MKAIQKHSSALLLSGPKLAMHCYRDLRISSRVLDEGAIIGFIEAFAQSTPGWSPGKQVHQ